MVATLVGVVFPARRTVLRRTGTFSYRSMEVLLVLVFLNVVVLLVLAVRLVAVSTTLPLPANIEVLGAFS